MTPPLVTPPPGSPPRSSGFALASMILGVCSFVMCLGPLTGIPAIIFGHKAQADIKRSGGTLQGSGLALGGLITGYLSFFMIFVIGLLAAIAIPNFVKARNQAQLRACHMNLKAIQDAKEAWARKNGKSEDAIPMESDLYGDTNEIRYQPSCPAGGSYLLNSIPESPTCAVHGPIAK
jgi:hypothetical protein